MGRMKTEAAIARAERLRAQRDEALRENDRCRVEAYHKVTDLLWARMEMYKNVAPVPDILERIVKELWRQYGR